MEDIKFESKPQISVIICCYSGEKTIESCLNSLFNQDLENSLFEVIIVDDGSLDDSAKLINKFLKESISKQHQNFRYFRKKNEGLSIARNFGLDKCKSELVVYIDEDALVYHNYLSVIIEYFKTNSIVNCLGGKVELYNKDNKFALLIQDSIFSLYMKNENSIIGTNMAFRKSFLNEVGGFQPEFTYRGDETALFKKSKGKLVKGRTDLMIVKHFQPPNSIAWLKTRYENGFFSIAIDFFMNVPRIQIFIKLLKSLLIVLSPFFILMGITLMFSSINMALFLLGIGLFIIFKKFFWNGLFYNTIKEFRINKEYNTRLREEFYIISLITRGVFVSNIGALKGYNKFKNVKWKQQ